jgi:3-(3-hydroxy-phenyl)propionate hydroxylase/flavoprotein hydroxylase
MPPFLGQGMCSGIRDAQNLAFKLDAVLDSADDAILDTFQTEREPHVRATIEKGIELGRVQTMRDPVAAAERDARLLAQRARRQKPEKLRLPGLGPGLHTGSEHAGRLVPQGRVAALDVHGLFDEVLGHGFVLLLDGRDRPGGVPLTASTADLAARLGVSVHYLADGGDGKGGIADLDGVYGAWFDENGSAAVLWRPDFYVFGAAESIADVPALLKELASAIEPSAAVPG